MKNILSKIESQWIFLIIAVLIFFVFALIRPDLVNQVIFSFGSLVIKILPILAIVFVLIFLFNYFVEPKKIIEFFGKGSGVKGWILAIIGGIISTGPIYLWYPLLSDLKDRGMRNALISAFLYNRAIKLQLIALMIYYFGLAYVLILSFYMLIFSIINGYLTEKLVPGKENKC